MVRPSIVFSVLCFLGASHGPRLMAQVTDERLLVEEQLYSEDSQGLQQSGHGFTYPPLTPEDLALKLSQQPPNEDDGTPRGGPPVNDLCANAISVTDGTYPFSTSGATSSGPTDTICNFGFADGGAVNSDIWYVYQAPYTGHVTVTLCGSAYDTKLAAYVRGCPTVNNEAIACDDDFCGVALPSLVRFDVVADEFYYIRVGGYNGLQGSGTMVISSGPAPANDDCANAIDLACDASVIADNSFATTAADDPPFGCHDGGAALGRGSLWYRFVSPHGSIQIKTCDTTGATNTLVGLYDGETGCPLTLLNELGCGEDECGGAGKHVFICIGSIVPGRTYYVQVATFADAGRGQIQLELDCPCPVGPDVIVGGLFGSGINPNNSAWNLVRNWGRVASLQTTGYSVGTISCNPGDVPVQWIATSDKHPVIGQQLYRLKNGRFEQIGMSWVKHGFLALTENYCQLGCDIPNPNNGSTLGVGCSDPYNADLNGTTTRLGPRGHINAFTGTFPYPYNTGVPFPPPGPPATIGRRLQVKDADLIPAQNLDSKYYIEGHYITSDDATLGNGLNNASTREVLVTNPSGTVYTLNMTGPDLRMTTGINLWKTNDPEVVETIIDVPAEGRFILAARATDLGNGTWNYEYALYNYNSDRSGQSVSVPVPDGVAVTNVGYHDVDYHSGDSLGFVSGAIENTDWTPTIDATSVSWATTPYATNVKANALRWATLYNYRFDAAASPTTGDLTIGLFKPGSPASVSGATLVPAPPVLVDIALSPPTQNAYVDDIVEITMSLTVQGASDGPVSKVDAILNWDPAYLEFVEYDVTGAGYAWATHGFPVDPDGLNVSLADGRAMFEVTANTGSPASAPAGPGSLEVAKFRFRALSLLPSGTDLSILPIEVIDQTQVIGAGTGDIRTGNFAGAATVAILPLPSPVVDLHLSPLTQTLDMGNAFEITMTVDTSLPSGVSFTAIDAVLSWDPAFFQLTGYDINTAGYPWFSHGFFANQDGLNVSLTDGDAMFTVLASPGNPALAPLVPGSLEVAKFQFQAVAGTESASLVFLPTYGAFSSTRVLGVTVGSDVTGDITAEAEVVINGPCSPTVGDVDGDSFYTYSDIDAAVSVYLEDDTNPDHIIAADANCDGFADGADIQPLVDFLLLVL